MSSEADQLSQADHITAFRSFMWSPWDGNAFLAAGDENWPFPPACWLLRWPSEDQERSFGDATGTATCCHIAESWSEM